MHFTKLVPSIFYADIQIALKTFIDCLEFTLGHSELHTSNPFCVVGKDGLSVMLFQNAEYAKNEHPEIRLVTNNINEVYERVASKFPELLHPNLKEVTLRPWGAKEFAMMDGQIGIRVQQWPNQVKTTQEYMLPYFGPIDPANLNWYYHTKIAFPDHDYIIGLDLNFKNKQIDAGMANDIANFLSDLEEIDKRNHLAIEKDFTDQVDETFGYIQFFIEELEEMELNEKQLLQKLRLVRVKLYPDNKYDIGYFAVFDYTIDIDGQPCNQVLVIKTGKEGTPIEITWES